MGRKKIEIAKIADANARQVCFSKRRGGLFKKASELSILCGAEIAVVVFSQAGKVFSFGSPNVDYVVDKHLHLTGGGQGEPPNLANYVDAERLEGLPALEQTYNGINEQLIAEKDRETSLKEEGKVLGVDQVQGQGQQPNDGSFCFWWQLYDADNDDVGGLQDKLNRLDNDYNILSRHLQIVQQQNAMALQQQQAQHQNYGFENPDLFQANYAPPNLEALSRMVPLPALQSGEENQVSGSEVQLMNVAVGLLPPNGMMYSTMEYGNSRGGAYNLQETNDGNQMSLPGQYNAPAAGSRDSTSVMGLRETFSELHPPYDGSSLEGFPFKGNPSL